ncbi:MAG: DeoR/GlpR family DNA-binding transcription regulator [Clostridia bacterium]|nr:DeoR/GlpR family DNA-binding transcription regulator [Clostridia bacterium]
MFAVERRNRIISLLNEKKSILVQETASLFGVTEETIRRDLKELELQGLLTRTHGGAVAIDDLKSEYPVEIRQGINIEGKNVIAREAAKLVNDGETIMIDASTSSLFLARHLKDKKNLTVITNAEKVVLELSECEDITIICTGGILRQRSMSYVGRAAEKALANYIADKVFFSCKGLLPNKGLMDSNEQESEIKKTMINCSQKVIFLCDHTKFGKVGYETTVSLDDVDIIVTDSPLPAEWSTAIKEKGVLIIERGKSNE